VLAASSISRSIDTQLRAGVFLNARVHAVFPSACYVVARAGDVLAVVPREVGDGPLSIVVPACNREFDTLQVGASVGFDTVGLRLGRLRVTLAHAAVWEPRPQWEALRAHRSDILGCVPHLYEYCARVASHESLMTLVERTVVPPSLAASLEGGQQLSHPRGGKHVSAVADAIRSVLDALTPTTSGDGELLKRALARLAGLGRGLTPAGDDFLVGLMYWGWLDSRDCRDYGWMIETCVAPRTTALSAAMLRAAARGECSVAWQLLLAAMSNKSSSELEAAAGRILGFGASSGADALAGFILAACRGSQHRGTLAAIGGCPIVSREV
jgi:hypothetical protein